MLSLIKEILCEKEIYLGKDNQKKTSYKFYFVLNNDMKIQFDPHESNFEDESKNFNSFGDIYKFLVDKVVVNDKTKKTNNKIDEK